MDSPMNAPQSNNGGRSPSLAGLKILLVEDETDVREVLAIVLEKGGATVHAAASVKEALDTLRVASPDVIITDIGMPHEDGYVLMEKVRAFEPLRGSRIPALALTGHVQSEDKERVIAAGFQMHLSKPVDPEDLHAAVARLAGRAFDRP